MSTRPGVTDPLWVRILLTALALLFLFGFLLIPLAAVFSQAFEQGWRAYLAALATPDTKSAVLLTMTVAVLAVPLNTAFGIAAAWAIARFEFPGKRAIAQAAAMPKAVFSGTASTATVMVSSTADFVSGVASAAR